MVLRVEETFYIFLPIVILLLPKTRKLFIAACLIIVGGYMRRSELYGDAGTDYL